MSWDDYFSCKKLVNSEDNIWLGVMRTLFGASMHLIDDENQFTLESWCYRDFDKAKEAFDKWDGNSPGGWYRHFKKGRLIDDKEG